MDCIKLSLWRSDVKNIIFNNSISCGFAFAIGEYIGQTFMINKAKWDNKIKYSYDLKSIISALTFGFSITYLASYTFWNQIKALDIKY